MLSVEGPSLAVCVTFSIGREPNRSAACEASFAVVESRVLSNVTSADKIGGVARVGGVAHGQQLVFLILPRPVPEKT